MPKNDLTISPFLLKPASHLWRFGVLHLSITSLLMHDIHHSFLLDILRLQLLLVKSDVINSINKGGTTVNSLGNDITSVHIAAATSLIFLLIGVTRSFSCNFQLF